ncbi:hypothetical protein GCM10007938_33910 [Vibrio zhanjiangensis]|uniref:Uncharacterized protein n=1 Tax=Vibrio zhanjiangensis TaxID=1046128 RepID=A0ABQ6F3R4_9VIBR|nr:hypothetical protein [Vibrio zhanjiangensis]GLT19609.1 hypothetical protein GCM10007938_33910 [Vibrio zhanjiangensis]
MVEAIQYHPQHSNSLSSSSNSNTYEFPNKLSVPNTLEYLTKTPELGIDTSLLQTLSSDMVASSVILFSNSEKSGAYNPEVSSIGISALPHSEKNNGAYVAQQISTLAHEMSHARDHIELHQFDSGLTNNLGKGAELSSIKALYRTELKAWVVEAMQCKLSKSTTNRMDLLLASAKQGISGVINSETNTFNSRIMAYKAQAGLPESWGADKILDKTKLKSNLDNALQLFEKTEIQSTDDAQHFLKELDMIFND